MSVIVRGMEMPESCEKCKIEREFLEGDVSFEDNDGFCPIANEYTDEVRNSGRLHSCPLGDVPTPHGDLIDRDNIDYYEVERNGEKHYMVWKPHIDGMPTIIESEEGI